MFYIYKIENQVNGKLYVGQTTKTILERWKAHLFIARGGKEKYPAQFFAIHAAIVKYGENSFHIQCLDQTDSLDELNEKEIFWINNLRQTHTLYNLTDGGKGSAGHSCPETAKQKISQANSGENNPFFGKKHSVETLRKFREDRQGKTHTDDTKKKISKSHKGNIITEEIAIEIINRLKNDQSMTDISKELNVGYSVVSGIKRNKNWKHLSR